MKWFHMEIIKKKKKRTLQSIHLLMFIINKYKFTFKYRMMSVVPIDIIVLNT